MNRACNTVGILLLFWVGFSCASFEEVIPESRYFVKYYGDAGADRGVDILSYEGGYVLLGTTASFRFLENPQRQGGESDIYLVFTDRAGNQVRSYVYDNEGVTSESAVIDEAVGVIRTEDG